MTAAIANRDDTAGTIAALEEAARVEDLMEYDEPEPLPFAARHWLGAALMEAGEFGRAEEQYRIELDNHPHDVWSLHGLSAALEAQGKVDAAYTIFALLCIELWCRLFIDKPAEAVAFDY